jgi:hypothetical protein
VACDGRLYFLRRRHANEGIREVTDRYIAQGWLEHSHTSGEVEVYRVTKHCPRYVKETPKGEIYLRELLKDAAQAAAEYRFEDFRAIAMDLARVLKSVEAGQDYGRLLFVEIMQSVERKVAEINKDPMIPEKIRLALQEIRMHQEAPH